MKQERPRFMVEDKGHFSSELKVTSITCTNRKRGLAMEKKYSNLYVLILAFTSSFGCHLSYVLSDEWKLSR